MIWINLFVIVSVLLIGEIQCQTWPTFHLYTKSNPTSGIQVTAATLPNAPGYNPNKDLKLVIHGFGSSQFSGSMTIIRDALISKTDANVIMVDWKQGAAQPNYFAAAPNTKRVGNSTADFLKALGVDYKKVHCIGHSLGAHACGFTGKNFKLARISGLDPAGPSFVGAAAASRLDKGDADLTDCLHTDEGLGIQQEICHKNYYPNGGKFQDGCPTLLPGKRDLDPSLYKNDPIQYELDTMVYHLRLSPDSREETDLVGCSHNRAPTYFAESITFNCGFTSTPCDNHKNFRNGLCSCNPTGGCCSMGYCADKLPDIGRFHLDTNLRSPFSKN